MIDSQVFKEPKMVMDAAGSLSTPFLRGAVGWASGRWHGVGTLQHRWGHSGASALGGGAHYQVPANAHVAGG